MLFHCSACNLGWGGLTGSGGRICLFCRRSMLSCPHIFWNPVLVTDSPPSCLEMWGQESIDLLQNRHIL